MVKISIQQLKNYFDLSYHFLTAFEESDSFKGFQLEIQHDKIVHWIPYLIGLPKAFKNSVQVGLDIN